MGIVVSVILESLCHLDPEAKGLHFHGANLMVSQFLRHVLTLPEVEALEVFLPPDELANEEGLSSAAAHALPEHRRGQGALRFYASPQIGDVWRDGVPRVLFTVEFDFALRDRYARDRFALGPMPHVLDVHSLGLHHMVAAMEPIYRAPSTGFDVIVALSSACAESLRRLGASLAGGPSPYAVETIHRFVDAKAFRPPTSEERLAARQALGLPDDADVGLYLGRITPYGKADLILAIEAFGQVAEPTDRLVIAGPAEPAGFVNLLTATAEHAGVGKQVLFIGKLGRNDGGALRALHAADFFLFPGDAMGESMANSVYEAMACGLPVLSSEWDGPRDGVTEGVTGYLASTTLLPGLDHLQELSPINEPLVQQLFMSQYISIDRDGFREALARMLRNRAERATMGAAARTVIDREYTWASISREWLALWRRLLEAAEAEPASARERRRDGALAQGITVPYADMFQMTGGAAPRSEDLLLALTPFGRAVAEGRTTVRFFDETLALVKPQIIDMAFSVLKSQPEMSHSTLVGKIKDGTAFDMPTISTNIALLVKRGTLKTSTTR